MTERPTEIKTSAIMRRIEKAAQLLEDATADGLQGYDPARLEDLVCRDVAEYLLIKKHRAQTIKRVAANPEGALRAPEAGRDTVPGREAPPRTAAEPNGHSPVEDIPPPKPPLKNDA